MKATPQLPREVVHSIFSLAGPGPNATSLAAVCHSWRSVAEAFLYRSITIFDKNTVRYTLRSCTGSIRFYYSKKENQKDGISIDIDNEAGVTKTRRLKLLCRTLAADNGRLAALAQELDFCINASEAKLLISVSSICRNVTHLYLRGPVGQIPSPEAATVKTAIKEMTNLELLASEGVFPWFTVADVAHILSNCPRIYSLTLRLTYREPDEEDGSRTLRFPQLRELRFVPFTITIVPVESYSTSFPSSSDFITLSALSFPNLTAFSAHLVLDDIALAPLKKCLSAWAPNLAELSLHAHKRMVGNGALDEILPSLTSMIGLDCGPGFFSPSAILRIKTPLKRLDLKGWTFLGDGRSINELCNGLEADRSIRDDRALPHLALVRAHIYDNPGTLMGGIQTRLMDVCRKRGITVERIQVVQQETGRRERIRRYARNDLS